MMSHNMNKITVLIITLMLILSLCACGGMEQQYVSDASATNDAGSGVDEAAADSADGEAEEAAADSADEGINEAAVEDGAEDADSSANVVNPVSEATAAEVLERTGVSFSIPAGAKDVSYFIIETDSCEIAEMDFRLNGAACACRICGTEVPTDGLQDISGMYYEWTSTDTAAISGNDAELYWIEEEQGIVLWYDYTVGLMYSLAVDSGASRDSLILLAEELYNPLQGDEDGASDEEIPAADNGADVENSTADSVAALAQSLIGAEYEWGAVGPDTFDNSGFVYYCFKESGITLPRKTADMFASGTAVEQEDLLPGDLVFFTYNEDESASYVGIYIGDGQFVAENNEDSPVCIHDMTLDYYTQIYIGARRYA